MAPYVEDPSAGYVETPYGPDVFGPDAAYLLNPSLTGLSSQTGTLNSGVFQRFSVNGTAAGEIVHMANATTGPNTGHPDFGIYGKSFNYTNMASVAVGASLVWDGTAWSPSNTAPTVSSWAGLTDPSVASFNAGTSGAGGMGITFLSGAIGNSFVLAGPSATGSTTAASSPTISLNGSYYTTSLLGYNVSQQVVVYANAPKGYVQWVATVAGTPTQLMYLEGDLNANGMLYLGAGAGVGMGRGALGGANSVAVGPAALQTATTSGGMTAIGAFAMQNATGSNDTGVGYNVMLLLTSGSRNTGVGTQVGSTYGPTTANDCTFLGYSTGFTSATQLNNAGAIGSQAVVYHANVTVVGSISGVNGSGVTTGLATPGGLVVGYTSATTPAAIGSINSYVAQTTLAGTTAGSVVWSMPFQGGSYKKFIAYFNGYENDTVTSQTITFSVAFSFNPLVTNSIGGLTITATTTTLTITAPDNTTTYSGWVVVEGY